MPLTADKTGRSHVGFNGQLHESATCWQILGNGYRAYCPVLMRFHSPDDQSPFGNGGVNAYAYSLGDPANHVDPTGHWARSIAFGAVGIGLVSGVGAVASHFSADDTARSLFGAIALGALTVAAMAGAAYLIPKTLAPKAFGKQPRPALFDGFGKRDIRVFQSKEGIHVIQMHGEPGYGILGNKMAGEREIASYVRAAARGAPIDELQMQVCFAANPGPVSIAQGVPLAQRVANTLGVPVTAFLGEVRDVGKRLTYKIGHERTFLPQRADGASQAAGAVSGGPPRVTALGRKLRLLRQS